jgi:hypothetical protein
MFRVLLAYATLACLATKMSAQSVARAWALDATIGVGRGWGGEYYAPIAPAAELTIALPHEASRFIGFAFGGHTAIPAGDVCHFNAAQTRCLHRFPGTFHFSVMGGLERTSKYDAVRVMVGPAYFGSDGNGYGALARLDGSAGSRHVAVIGALQGAIDFRSNETLRFGTVLFGMRLR